MTAMLPESDNRLDYEISPERRLMIAVLNTAIIDAAGGCIGIPRPSERDYARRRALLWLRDGGRDFRSICELAGLDPLDVQTRALQFIDSGRKIPNIKRVSASIRDSRPRIPAYA